jgi:polysaccharide export outer membrane protein
MRLLFAFLVLIVATNLVFSQESFIKAGDVINVSVDGETLMSRQYRVDQNGMAIIELVGAVKLGGLSTDAAAKLIADKIKSRQILKDPQVVVKLVPNQVFVSGSVSNPGSIAITPNLKLSDVLKTASPTETADLTSVRVTHSDGQQLTIDYEKLSTTPENDIVLQPGDQVFVFQRAVNQGIMVSGQVKAPQTIPFEPGLTINGAISKAGGVLQEADLSQVKLTRASGGPANIIDLSKSGTDTPLSPGDQILVPQKTNNVYVLVRGAVKRSGLVAYHEGLTLREALEAADLLEDAQLNKVTIERRIDGKIQKIKVNYTEILRGVRTDEVLQPGDVLDVPNPPRSQGTSNILQAASLVVGIIFFFLK